MITTHTPGPWKLNGSQVTANGDWKAPVCVVVSKEDMRPTADAAAQTMEQAHANARLIAAAPDLLEALQQMTRLAAKWEDAAKDNDVWPDNADEVHAFASAAIARATA